MLQVCTLASSSAGNCTFISDGTTSILLDVGISCKRISAELADIGHSLDEISGILITHEHGDHIYGLTTILKKYKTPYYCTPGTGRGICYKIAAAEDQLNKIEPGTPFQIGTLHITPFRTSHDSLESCAYRVTGGNRTMALCTDTGYVTETILENVTGLDLFIAEANHDINMLKFGPYPYRLKSRILSDAGHLSNDAGANMVCHAIRNGCTNIILAHLSSENNSPRTAFNAVNTAIQNMDPAPDAGISLSVAPREKHGPIFTLE